MAPRRAEMDSKKVAAVGIVVAIAAFAAYAATGFFGDGPPDLEPIPGVVDIGVLAASSGDFGTYGRENAEAARLAEARFNEYLGEIGEEWRISVTVRDTQSDPDVALEMLAELNESGIKLVSGPETSASITNIKGYAEENGMVLFSCCSTAPSLAIPDDPVFRLITDDRSQGGVFRAVLAHEGIEAAVPVWRGDVWGDGLHEAAGAALGGVMLDGVRYDPETADFAAVASELAGIVRDASDEHGAGATAVIYMGFGEMAELAGEAAAHDILAGTRWFGSDASTNDPALAAGAALAFTEGARFTTIQASASGGSHFYGVRDHVRGITGSEPSTFAHATYDTVWLLGLAVLEAGSSEAWIVRDALPVVADRHEGAIGGTALNEAGDLASSDYDIWGVRDGSWKRIGSFGHEYGRITLDEAGLGEVSVGMLVPLTGDLAMFGEEVLIATQLGVADFNGHLEETGETWRMALEIRDTGSGAEGAIAGLESLDGAGIGVILGATSSQTLTGAKGYTDGAGMAVLACCSSAPSLAIEGDSIFRMVPDDRQHAAAMARLMEQEGITTVVPAWRGDAWGDGLRQAGADEFSGEFDEGVRYEPGGDIGAAAASLAARVQEAGSGASEVAVWYMGFSEMAEFIDEAAAHGVLAGTRWFGSGPSTGDLGLVGDPGRAEFMRGTGLLMVIAAASEGPVAARVSDHVRGELGSDANAYAHTAYDAAWIAGLAISGAGSADPGAVRGALGAAAEGYGGAFGGITLNAAGDSAGADYDVWGIDGSGWARVGTYSGADGTVELSGTRDVTGTLLIGRLAPEALEHSHNPENAEAAELALAEFNRDLDARGAGWDLDMEVARYGEDGALAAITGLHGAGARIIVGPDNSASLAQVADFARENGLVLLSCCSTAPELAVQDGIFRLVPDDTGQAAALASLMSHEGIGSAVPVWRGDIWGDGLVGALRDEFPGMLPGIRYDPGSADYAGLASDLAAAVAEAALAGGSGRVAVVYAGFEEITGVMGAAASHGILAETRWFGTDASARDASVSDGSAAAAFAEAARFTTVQAGAQDNPVKDMVEAHVMRVLGRAPSSYADSMFDAVWLAGLAAEASAGGGDAAALLPGIAERYSGALGGTRLNGAGDLEGSGYDIWGLEDGAWAKVGRYSGGATSLR